MRVPPLAQVAALALPLLGLPPEAQAQPPSQQGGTVRVGTLRCDVAGSTSFVFGSTRAIGCEFVNVNGRRERYTGEISRYGVDLGFTGAAVMLWVVVAPTTDPQPGVLAGTFVGASGAAAVGIAPEALAQAPPGQPEGAAAAHTAEALVTVEAVDQTSREVVLRGTSG